MMHLVVHFFYFIVVDKNQAMEPIEQSTMTTIKIVDIQEYLLETI